MSFDVNRVYNRKSSHLFLYETLKRVSVYLCIYENFSRKKKKQKQYTQAYVRVDYYSRVRQTSDKQTAGRIEIYKTLNE